MNFDLGPEVWADGVCETEGDLGDGLGCGPAAQDVTRRRGKGERERAWAGGTVLVNDDARRRRRALLKPPQEKDLLRRDRDRAVPVVAERNGVVYAEQLENLPTRRRDVRHRDANRFGRRRALGLRNAQLEDDRNGRRWLCGGAQSESPGRRQSEEDREDA